MRDKILIAVLALAIGAAIGWYWLPDSGSDAPGSEAECFATVARANTREGALIVGDYCERQYRSEPERPEDGVGVIFDLPDLEPPPGFVPER